MKRLVFATHNRGKLAELRSLLAGLEGLEAAAGARWEVVTLGDLGFPDDVVEDGATFHDNARKKAEAALARTGLPSLADDSGLEVDLLGGAPGVRSARYAGEAATDAENNARLVEEIAARAGERGPFAARFRCVLALARPGAAVHFAEGTVEGEICTAPRGGGGFGYDPYFVIAGSGRTLAELPLDEKNRLSHRGQAMRRLAEMLRRL